MKLSRVGPVGHERPVAVDRDGVMRDLSGIIDDISARQIANGVIADLLKLDLATLPALTQPVRYGVPVAGISKFIGIGLNFADHAREVGLPVPPEPILFSKAVSCLNGPDDNVILPRGSIKSDWEVELGVFIGKTCRYVSEADALEHVAGYVLINDISEREYQKERGSQWDKGKGCDTFGPVGPWLVTPDEIGDVQALPMSLHLNGRSMQSGNTSTMVFSVRQIIAYVSRFMTLLPGDLIATGTPPGVGEGQKPSPIYLADGDRMNLSIEGLGKQQQHVVAG